MIPEGWKEKPLDDLADYINGRAFKPADWKKSGLPIIRIAQITNPNSELDYYDGSDVDDRNLITNGDLIFSWSATLATIFWDRGDGILNQHLFKVVPRKDTDKSYLKQLID
jgi:type I restriction enzyme S subunit